MSFHEKRQASSARSAEITAAINVRRDLPPPFYIMQTRHVVPPSFREMWEYNEDDFAASYQEQMRQEQVAKCRQDDRGRARPASLRNLPR